MAGRRGGAGQDGTPTEQFAHETSAPRTLQGIEDTSLERFSRSTNKRNPMRQSNPKPGHTTGGSGRAARCGAAGHGGPGRMGRRRVSPQDTAVSRVFQGIEDNCPEHFLGSTNKRNLI